MRSAARAWVSASTVLLLAAAAAAQSPPRFCTPRLDVGRLPVDVVVGDLNHDTNLDVLAINSTTDDVSVLLGDGAGGLALDTHVAVGDGPFAPALADFDGDSDLDLLVTHLAPKNVMLLRGDGLGGLAPVSTTSVGISADRIAVADVDLDGDLDAAVGTFNSIKLLKNDGTIAGTFTTSALVSDPAAAFTLGDVTDDAIPDLLTTPYPSLRLEVRRGVGNGTFAPPSATNINGQAAGDIALFDAEGDGDLDVALALTADGNVTVVENLPGVTFLQKIQVSTPYPPKRVAIADETGDGQLDLVGMGTNAASVFAGSGAGTYAPVSPRAVLGVGALADMNGDGRLDFVTARFYFGAKIGSVDVAMRDSLGRSEGLPLNPYEDARATLDLDQDGDLDFLGFGNGAIQIVTQVNDGLANFVEGPVSAVPGPGFGGYAPIPGDFDNDGIDDLLWTNGANQLVCAIGAGNGTFPAASSSPLTQVAGHQYRSVVVDDVDNDGSLDAVVDRYDTAVQSSVLVGCAGDGAGGFVQQGGAQFGKFYPNVSRPFSVADVDSDGLLDLVAGDAAVALPNAGRVSVARSSGAFQWSAPQSTPIAGVPPLRVLAGDFDGDGNVDVAAHYADAFVSGPNGRIAVMHGAGAGALVPAQTLDVGKLDPNVSDIAVADLDGDGALDLACDTPAIAGMLLFHNTGTSFVLAESYSFGQLFGRLDAFDLDQDGRMDVRGGQGAVLLQQAPQPICPGGYATYGQGCFGDSYFVPHLSGQGCPTPGGAMVLRVDNAPPAVVALLFMSNASANVPIGYGCKFLVAPAASALLPVPIGGSGVGGGSIALYGVLPPSTPTGASAYLQMFCPTNAVPWGFASTNGLRIDL